MPVLSLKASHKAVAAYYASLAKFDRLGVKHEGAVRSAFQTLLDHCAKQVARVLVPEYRVARKGGKQVIADGAMLDQFAKAFNLGLWEAKDSDDDLEKEIKAKFAAGYPRDNILFQAPHHAVLYQDGERFFEADLRDPEKLVHILSLFFAWRHPVHQEWEKAADDFKQRVPEIGDSLAKIIRRERQEGAKFKPAFTAFLALCRNSLNPNLAEAAVEEMIVQHLLTERIFRKIFDIGDFMRRNVIAVEIEKVIGALTDRSFDRDHFQRSLDPFYVAIEHAAETIHDFSEKQKFLNIVYERFFQGFCVKVADTHGIVYTPQPLVDFMVASTEHILREHFGTGLAEKDVHILDPFTGTGNFIVNIMERIPPRALPHKFREELFCNEVMLLPYYIASMNIEHKYWEKIKSYEAFEGICLVDTFDTITGEAAYSVQETREQDEFGAFFNEANSARIQRQKKQSIKVVIANPPYNAWQQDENDDNKNRKYPETDRRVKVTYSADSKATLRNSLGDPYVKAIRYATDRIGKCGVVCYVTNNGFIDGMACDGVRKHLAQDFDLIYVLDLGGNVRKNPKLSGSTHNVFGIQVGVSISLFIRLPRTLKYGERRKARILYHAVPVDWRCDEKYRFLDGKQSVAGVKWKMIKPDAKHTWLTSGLDSDFGKFLPIGLKHEGIETGSIFEDFCRGACTNNDDFVYDFDRERLAQRAGEMVGNYQTEQLRWQRHGGGDKKVEDVIRIDPTKLKWIRRTKRELERGTDVEFDEGDIHPALYRPFCQRHLYFHRAFNEDRYKLPSFFRRRKRDPELLALVVTDAGSDKPFMVLATHLIPDLHLVGGGASAQVFPMRIRDGDGKQQDNIRRDAVNRFTAHYDDGTITREDIFHYTYAVLHHPEYRARYAANLKRELPRMPFAPDFRAYAKAGRRLAELHVDYERQPEFPLKIVEHRDTPLDWRVEAMKLSKDRIELRYNDHFTFAGIPAAAFDYRLGNRSALEWVIDQYRVTRDAGDEIASDPNRDDDGEYIARLVRQVVTVSVETVKVVNALPGLGLP